MDLCVGSRANRLLLPPGSIAKGSKERLHSQWQWYEHRLLKNKMLSLKGNSSEGCWLCQLFRENNYSVGFLWHVTGLIQRRMITTTLPQNMYSTYHYFFLKHILMNHLFTSKGSQVEGRNMSIEGKPTGWNSRCSIPTVIPHMTLGKSCSYLSQPEFSHLKLPLTYRINLKILIAYLNQAGD